MPKQFKEQGGAATMDPGSIRCWLTSKMMTRISSKQTQTKIQRQAELEVQLAEYRANARAPLWPATTQMPVTTSSAIPSQSMAA